MRFHVCGECFKIEMGIGENLGTIGTSHTATVDDRRMVEFVRMNDDTASAEGCKKSEVGCESGGEENCRFSASPSGEAFFKVVVNGS